MLFATLGRAMPSMLIVVSTAYGKFILSEDHAARRLVLPSAKHWDEANILGTCVLAAEESARGPKKLGK